jgi:hypothetical protein
MSIPSEGESCNLSAPLVRCSATMYSYFGPYQPGKWRIAIVSQDATIFAIYVIVLYISHLGIISDTARLA